MKGKPRLLSRIIPILGERSQEKQAITNLVGMIKLEKHLHHDAIKMIEGVIRISNIKARDIMLPRSKMVAIDEDSSFDDMIATVVDSGHSRFPVIGENRDEVKGFILAKDLLKYHRNHQKSNLTSLIRPAFFVPDSKRLDVLLREFRQQHRHLAIVLDEYGSVAGIITIEDILEQIVGSIEDELDGIQDIHIEQLSKTKFLINALTSIEEFNEYFNTDLDTGQFDTIGGLVTHAIGHVAQKGEKAIIANRFHFKVLNTSNKHIKLLQLKINN